MGFCLKRMLASMGDEEHLLAAVFPVNAKAYGVLYTQLIMQP